MIRLDKNCHLHLLYWWVAFGLPIVGAQVVQYYKAGDKIDLFVNKVGPYNNPDETYHFYTLPICQPEKVKHKSMTLGEVLKGDRLAYSNFDIKFNSEL